jgi:anti-sigma factor RsiW
MSEYLDAEQNSAERQQLQSHLDSCEQCRGALDELRTLQGRVAQSAKRHAAPPHLKHRIHAALKAEQAATRKRTPKPRSWPWAWINLGLAGASTAAFAVTLALYLGQPSSSELREQELVASHFRSLMPDHLADVASTDQHTVKPWFTGKLDYSPPVYDLAQQGHPLIGGRLDYLNRRPVAALAYRHRLHIINLYVWPDASQHDTAPHVSSRQGFQMVRWSQNGMQFAAISDISAQDLVEFKRQIHDKVAQAAMQ